jgi:hypothetical protein
MSDPYQYMFSDYSGTGEGRTMCVLITRAYPKRDDYEVQPDFVEDADGKPQYVPGKLKYSQKFIAAREFKERFGDFYIHFAENLSKEDFLIRCGRLLPEMVLKLVNSKDQPGNLHFAQEFHFNFS